MTHEHHLFESFQIQISDAHVSLMVIFHNPDRQTCCDEANKHMTLSLLIVHALGIVYTVVTGFNINLH